MIFLYGIRSPFVFRVRAALEYKGLAYQHVSVNLKNRSPDFLAISPIGKIPVLQDEDGTLVHDSANIISYLDGRYPDTYEMLSRDAKERAAIGTVVALADRLSEVSSPYTYAALGFRTSTDEEKATAVEATATYLQRAGEMLAGKDFFVAGRVTAADIAMLSILGVLLRANMDTAPLTDWTNRMMADPMVMKMFPPEDEKGVREI